MLYQGEGSVGSVLDDGTPVMVAAPRLFLPGHDVASTTPVEPVLVFLGQVHEHVVGIIAFGTLAKLQSTSSDGQRVGVIHPTQLPF